MTEAACAEANRLERDWQLEDAARVLLELQGNECGSVAVGLLAVFGPRWGWGAQWVNTLRALREHGDLDVRLAARELWLA
ncbi:MAG TPA: hypothetical protein VHM70_27715 [Polyangiaceae bacterium]|nr:hypothetical protein [Polyangiaceae bacterium]